MREDRLKQAFKLRLLALVLALALTWYAVNPAPGPVRRRKREGDQPEAKKRDALHQADDLNWPEVITID